MPINNWYPGHIAKAERKLKELVGLVDIAVILVDVRIPISSFYGDLTKLIGEKPQLLLLNKADLADPASTDLWKEYYEELGYKVLITNCLSTKDVNKITKECYELGKPKIERLMAKGRLPRAVRVMIMGMPNVGKSSLINRLIKCSKTKVGSKAGVTRTMQWVRINPKLELLDTPGIIPMKLNDKEQATNLAFVSSIGDNAYDTEEISKELLTKLWEITPDALREYYNLQEDKEPSVEDIAISRNFLKEGNTPDTLRACQKILSDFRAGKIGRVTLEQSPNFKVKRTNSF